MHPRYAGSLEDTDLLGLLSILYEERRTGNLIIHRDNQVKSLYIRNGNIVFASSNQTGDRLAQILFRDGTLTRIQLDYVLSEIRKSGKRQGTVLLEQGIMTPQQLEDAVALQVKEILFSILLWEGGSYVFHPGERPRQPIPASLDTASLVREMIDRLRRE